MLITATTTTVLMTRYPPFHGFGAHTYNWDCGSAFYDTSVQILSVQQDAILRKVFWLLFGSIQWIYNTTSLVTTSHSHRILTKVLWKCWSHSQQFWFKQCPPQSENTLTLELQFNYIQSYLRYPPIHGWGVDTYNWDCGAGFYDTSVLSILSRELFLFNLTSYGTETIWNALSKNNIWYS